jgi:hypothetical protein
MPASLLPNLAATCAPLIAAALPPSSAARCCLLDTLLGACMLPTPLCCAPRWAAAPAPVAVPPPARHRGHLRAPRRSGAAAGAPAAVLLPQGVPCQAAGPGQGVRLVPLRRSRACPRPPQRPRQGAPPPAAAWHYGAPNYCTVRPCVAYTVKAGEIYVMYIHYLRYQYGQYGYRIVSGLNGHLTLV